MSLHLLTGSKSCVLTNGAGCLLMCSTSATTALLSWQQHNSRVSHKNIEQPWREGVNRLPPSERACMRKAICHVYELFPVVAVCHTLAASCSFSSPLCGMNEQRRELEQKERKNCALLCFFVSSLQWAVYCDNENVWISFKSLSYI